MTVRPEAGSRWRLLVHDQDPDKPGHYLTSHHIQPTEPSKPDREWMETHVLPGAIFDEVVCGSWLHVESMGSTDDDGKLATDGTEVWWMQVAGATLWVHVDPGGRPTNLTYYPPGAYADAVEGCTYHEYGEDLP